MSSSTIHEKRAGLKIAATGTGGYPPTHDGEVRENNFERNRLVLLESQILREDPKPLLM
jgi:hypothetical protein